MSSVGTRSPRIARVEFKVGRSLKEPSRYPTPSCTSTRSVRGLPRFQTCPGRLTSSPGDALGLHACPAQGLPDRFGPSAHARAHAGCGGQCGGAAHGRRGGLGAEHKAPAQRPSADYAPPDSRRAHRRYSHDAPDRPHSRPSGPQASACSPNRPRAWAPLPEPDRFLWASPCSGQLYPFPAYVPFQHLSERQRAPRGQLS